VGGTGHGAVDGDLGGGDLYGVRGAAVVQIDLPVVSRELVDLERDQGVYC
jgi:hypothetical protein